MIRTSKAPFPWTLPWDERYTFFLRAGDVMERAAFEAELAGEYLAGRVFRFEIDAAFADGIAAFLKDAPDDASMVQQLADSEAAGEKLNDEDAALLAEARSIVAQHWPKYRALLKKSERRTAITPVLAFRTFCTGWEGPDLPLFEKGPDGLVSLACMERIDALAVQAAGAHAYGMLYAGGQEKNSAPPSKSGGAQGTSSSPRRPVDGKSKAKGGRKTRSSFSQPKS